MVKAAVPVGVVQRIDPFRHEKDQHEDECDTHNAEPNHLLPPFGYIRAFSLFDAGLRFPRQF